MASELAVKECKGFDFRLVGIELYDRYGLQHATPRTTIFDVQDYGASRI